jgi:serine/threonine kinase 16
LQEHAAEQCTAPYRAPELFLVSSPSNIDERTDIWSLGCILYALAYLTPPFDGSATATIGGKVRYPENDEPYYPAIVNDLIAFMLVGNLKDRPTIQQVIDKACSSSWDK